MTFPRPALLAAFTMVLALVSHNAAADDASKPVPATSDKPPAKPAAKPPTPLNPQKTVLLDSAEKRLLLKCKVALRTGVLEMLLCRAGTKEHESIFAIDSDAWVIHTGLLALGAKSGTPVGYKDNMIIPPTGTKIDIFCTWADKDDTIHRVKAQSLIRHAINRFQVVTMKARPEGLVTPEDSELRYDETLNELIWYGPMTAAQRDEFLKLSKDKAYQDAIKKFYARSQSRPMKAHWVFAGSGFYTETMGPDKGKKYYQAEGGDVICVANFPSAMLDINEPSSADGEDSLLYEAWTDKLPPEGTIVTLELIPVFEPKEKKKPEAADSDS